MSTWARARRGVTGRCARCCVCCYLLLLLLVLLPPPLLSNLIFLVFVFVMIAANKPARPTRLLVVDGRGPRRAARVVAEGGPADAQQLAQLLGPLPAEEESEKGSAPCGRRAFRRA